MYLYNNTRVGTINIEQTKILSMRLDYKSIINNSNFLI